LKVQLASIFLLFTLVGKSSIEMDMSWIFYDQGRKSLKLHIYFFSGERWDFGSSFWIKVLKRYSIYSTETFSSRMKLKILFKSFSDTFTKKCILNKNAHISSLWLSKSTNSYRKNFTFMGKKSLLNFKIRLLGRKNIHFCRAKKHFNTF